MKKKGPLIITEVDGEPVLLIIPRAMLEGTEPVNGPVLEPWLTEEERQEYWEQEIDRCVEEHQRVEQQDNVDPDRRKNPWADDPPEETNE